MSLYGLIIGITISICFFIFSKKNNIIPKDLENFFVYGTIIFAIIGARAYHIIDQWAYYSQHLWQIPNTRAGGLGIFGGIIGGFIFILIFSLIKKINLLKILDSITLVLPLGQGIGRFGNYINHENPIWWHESILDFLLFIFISKYSKNSTAKYLIGYGLIRFFTEFLRTDTWVINNLKIGQLLSIIFIIIGLFTHYFENKHKV